MNRAIAIGVAVGLVSAAAPARSGAQTVVRPPPPPTWINLTPPAPDPPKPFVDNPINPNGPDPAPAPAPTPLIVLPSIAPLPPPAVPKTRRLRALPGSSLAQFLVDKQGFALEYAREVAAAFAGTTIALVRTTATIRVERLFGGGARELGRWYFERGQCNVGNRFALPPQNDSDRLALVEIPAGTLLLVGDAAPLFGRPGGGRQLLALSLDGLRVVGRRGSLAARPASPCAASFAAGLVGGALIAGGAAAAYDYVVARPRRRR